MGRVPPTTWQAQAEQLTAAAQRAQQAGDDLAFIALITGAAQCLQIARLLNPEACHD